MIAEPAAAAFHYWVDCVAAEQSCVAVEQHCVAVVQHCVAAELRYVVEELHCAGVKIEPAVYYYLVALFSYWKELNYVTSFAHATDSLIDFVCHY